LELQNNYNNLTKGFEKEQVRISIERSSLEELRIDLLSSKNDLEKKIAELKSEEKNVKLQSDTIMLEQKFLVSQAVAEVQQSQIIKDNLALEITYLKNEKERIDRVVKEVELDLILKNEKIEQLYKDEKIALSDLVKTKALNDEIIFHRDRREVSKGLIGTLFGTKEQPQSAKDRIAEIRKEIDKIENAISESISLVRTQQSLKITLDDKKSWLNKVAERIITIENKEAKQQSLKNKAAENIKTKRQIANGIKKNLADNDECPYCGYELTTSVHADHIYPVSKGGESTKRNMVLVCSDCNSKKSSMTLQAFIKKYNLNREQIENKLEELGKDF